MFDLGFEVAVKRKTGLITEGKFPAAKRASRSVTDTRPLGDDINLHFFKIKNYNLTFVKFSHNLP